MSDTIAVKEAAKLWGERRVTVLCKEVRKKGAYKKNRSWVISMDAEKTADIRIKTVYIEKPKHCMTYRCR